MGVIACAQAVFGLTLWRYVPALVAAGVGGALYIATMRRFIAQMRDQPRPRWVTRLLDEPLFAHFGASTLALLASPACAVIAVGLRLSQGPASGSVWAWWQASEGSLYALGLLVSAWSIWVERRFVRVRRVAVAVRDLPPEFEGYRITQLSDLHVGSFDPKVRALEWVALSNSLAPDLAVVTGDLVTSGSGFYRDVAEALAELRAKDGVFVSMGNHDQSHNDELTRLIVERGPTVLRNAAHTLERGEAELVIGGLDGRIGSPADVTRVIGTFPRKAPLVLLSHYPWAFDAAVAAGVDLVLTGHTHGGQIAVPFFSQRYNLARLTGQRSRGLVLSGKTVMYVNAGLGTTGPPMRLAVPPEIALITLHRA